MKLYLFGGAEIDQGQFEPQIRLIEEVIKEINPKQLLHIPFARKSPTETSWKGDWFNKNIHVEGLEYLNAENDADIDKADSPLIFISGGGKNVNLLEEIQARPKLLELIKNSSHIIGESAGTKVLCAYFREKGSDENSKVLKGLNIIKDTVIEPHYTERNRHETLPKTMEKAGVSYGIGIDCVTAIVFELDEFPEKYEKIGSGVVDVKKS